MNQWVAGTLVIGGMVLAVIDPTLLAGILVVIVAVLWVQDLAKRSQR